MTALKATAAPPAGTAYAEDFHTWTQEQGARLEAAKETRPPLKRFPEACPYTDQDIMDRSFPIDPDA